MADENERPGDLGGGDRKGPNPTNMYDQYDGVDWLLAHIVWIANFGVEIGITLSVGGQLVTGQVISGRKYLEEIAKGFAEAKVTAGMEDLRGTLNTSFVGFADAVYPKRDEPDMSSMASNKPSYIHLADVKFPLGNNLVGGGPRSLWRAKLASVDAFQIGTLTSS
jgi:hypothetical protein